MDSISENNINSSVIQDHSLWIRDKWNNDADNLKCSTEDEIVNHIAELLAFGQCYKWAGLALLAVNPCENIPHLYSKDVKELYNSFEKDGIKTNLQPHVYAVAARARHRIVYEIGSVNQIISISGDSGSGKTYSAKQILEFLSTYDLRDSQYDVAKVPGTLWQIWCSVPVLTAFGNAQTECNDNSSRFGKLLQLQYEEGKIMGAFIQTYLLEKTRVAFQGSKERNFHIFHQLLSGLSQSELSSLHLSHKTFYRIVPGAINLEDRNKLLETKVAMMDIGITEKMKQHVFMVLAAIIHLGNISFMWRNDHFDVDKNSLATAQYVCQLLGLEETSLKQLLVSKQISAQSNARRRMSVYHKPAGSVEECNVKRDCLMRLLYERLFLWIVSMINSKVQADGHYQELGILDIYGFEVFEHNSLEQLCINYANERLQQFFVRDFIKHQQEIFIEEDIHVNLPSDLENEERLRLLDSSLSLFGILNEECALQRRTSDTMLYQRISSMFKDSPILTFSSPNTGAAEHPQFMFRHYAGQVSYSIHHMLEKNMDHIPPELCESLGHSSHPFVRQLFHNSFQIYRKHTLLAKFKGFLDSLIKTLETADVHYIRCIKAAPKLVPKLVEKPYLKQQLKASGIMEIVFINQHHFPVMTKYVDIEERYGIITKQVQKKLPVYHNDAQITETVHQGDSCNSLIKETITLILGTSFLNKNVFFGKHTLFLTESAMLQLENYRYATRTEAAKLIQNSWRKHVIRKELKTKKLEDEKQTSAPKSDIKETDEPEDKDRFKDLTDLKLPKLPRCLYISKGIVSRRPIAKVPVRLHIKRTCLPYSHCLPISEIPRGLEDALF